jgi:hypothetical protein
MINGSLNNSFQLQGEKQSVLNSLKGKEFLFCVKSLLQS